MAESDRTKKVQSRVIYSTYLIEKDYVEKGIIVPGKPITSGDLTEYIATGPTYFTALELNTDLINNGVVIPTLNNSSVPTEPLNVSGFPGNTLVILSWLPPLSDGNLTIIKYTVYIYNSVDILVCVHNVYNSLTYTFTNLINDTPYTFKIFAVNLYGNSPFSSPITVTPTITAPYTPTNVTGISGNTQVTVSWTAPYNGGLEITSYRITSNTGEFTDLGNVTTGVVTGLTNGTPYTFTVVATNALGNSSPSSASSPVTPATVPDAPTSVTGVSGNAEVTVSWTAPYNGGSAITNYRITSSPGSFTADVSGNVTIGIVTGLTNGTAYTFTVVATNTAGNSLASFASSPVTPETVPSAPTNVVGVLGNTEVTVSWTASYDGGSAITNYRITSNTGEYTDVGNVTTGVVTGLTNGTPYTFTVVATNKNGDSLPSSPSGSVTPASVPGQPTNVTGVSGNAQVTVSWTAPYNGGLEITRYRITSNTGSFTDVSGVLTTGIVTGLTNGTAYTFTVVATNAAGDSLPSSASSAVTPESTSVPGIPQGVSLELGGDNIVRVYWYSSQDTIYNYYVYMYDASNNLLNRYTLSSNAGQANITGLTLQTLYTFRVSADNAFGEGDKSAPLSITVYNVPSNITSISGNVGNTEATITWDAPTDNGGTNIVVYTVHVYDSSDNQLSTKDVSGTILSTIITGLTNGTLYKFAISASNGYLANDPGTIVTVTPGRIPDTPIPTLVATAYNYIEFSWTAPYNGGYEITSYAIRVFTASDVEIPALNKSVSGTSTIVTGLTNGTIYRFSVTAVNSLGSSAQSTKVQATTSSSPSAPSVPQDVSGNPGIDQATINWSTPVSDGGSAITAYKVTEYDASNNQLLFVDVSNNVFTNTFTDLSGGILYKFSVSAVNAIGTTTSNKISVIPQNVPGPVRDLSGNLVGPIVSINWLPPSNTGGLPITAYKVNGNNNGLDPSYSTSLGGGAGLYDYIVKAVNSIGDSSGSTITINYITVPGQLQTRYNPLATVQVGNTEIYITWSPPNTGGSPITTYTLEVSDGVPVEFDVSGANTSYLITGLTNGTSYTIRIRANNIVGSGLYNTYFSADGTSTSFTPLGVPFPPTDVSGVLAAGIQVSWTAPTNTGDSAIIGYRAISTPGNFFTDVSGTTALVTGLAKGETYTFKVRATNTEGPSIYSSPSASILYPTTVPGVMTGSSSYDDPDINVYWSPPDDTGGLEIDGYKIKSYKDTVFDREELFDGTTFTWLYASPTSGSYTFTFFARNSLGYSTESAPIDPVVVP
jgi:titin